MFIIGDKYRHMENPWLCYEYKSQRNNYVHPLDTEKVDSLNGRFGDKDKFRIHVNSLPKPYIGKVLEADILVLNKNNAFDKNEELPDFYESYGHLWIEQAKMDYGNLAELYSEKYIKNSPYWYNRFKKLCSAVSGKKYISVEDYKEIISNSVAIIQFYPYSSVRFDNSKFINPKNKKGVANEYVLPTQRFGFDLVKKAMERNAFIIIGFGKSLWPLYVEGLEGYEKKISLKSDLQNHVSKENCYPADWDKWNELVKTLKKK